MVRMSNLQVAVVCKKLPSMAEHWRHHLVLDLVTECPSLGIFRRGKGIPLFSLRISRTCVFFLRMNHKIRELDLTQTSNQSLSVIVFELSFSFFSPFSLVPSYQVKIMVSFRQWVCLKREKEICGWTGQGSWLQMFVGLSCWGWRKIVQDSHMGESSNRGYRDAVLGGYKNFLTIPVILWVNLPFFRKVFEYWVID
jgi:hypothetical protein